MQAARTLFDAARAGNIEEIHAFLESGSNPNALKNGVPAVWYAVRSGNEAAAMVLFDKTDSELLNNSHSDSGGTMLHTAASSGLEGLIRAAIASGANPNILDQNNVPAVWHAVYSNNAEEIVMALLKETDSELLSNIHSYCGTNVLHLAAARGMRNLIKAAVAKGADPYVKNSKGKSSIDLIKMSDLGHEEKQALLRDVMDEHAWAKRGSLVMLRRRFKQAWEAECDAGDVASAQAPSAAPDA